jgi:hypothetical protein
MNERFLKLCTTLTLCRHNFQFIHNLPASSATPTGLYNNQLVIARINMLAEIVTVFHLRAERLALSFQPTCRLINRFNQLRGHSHKRNIHLTPVSVLVLPFQINSVFRVLSG